MGQCTSSKSIKVASFMNNRTYPEKIPQNRKIMEKNKSISRGEATSFGFKKPQTSKNGNQAKTQQLPSLVANVTHETIEPLVIAPVQTKVKSKKDEKKANRFGFRPVVPTHKIADTSADMKKDSSRSLSAPPSRLNGSSRSLSETRSNKSNSSADSNSAAKFTLQTSHLPRPQTAVRVISNGNQFGQPLTDKWAKTVVNNHTANLTPNSNRLHNYQHNLKLGEPSQFEIRQLEESPSASNKFQSSLKFSRPTEIFTSNSRLKTFNLNEYSCGNRDPSIKRNEQQDIRNNSGINSFRSPIINYNCTSNNFRQTTDNTFGELNSLVRSTDSIEEEKHIRDLEASEKDISRFHIDGIIPDEVWGHGEAMANEEGLTAVLGELDQTPDCLDIPIRPVHLKIEDKSLEKSLLLSSISAMASSTLLEDEKSPETPSDLSCSPPSVEPLPPPPNLNKESPGSPISPTHATNSYSSDAKDRDFLIDDEIADQPALMFNGTGNHFHPMKGNHVTPQSITNLAGQVSRVLANISSSPIRGRISTTSLGTLSPCESLASDDLMVDFEKIDLSNLDDINDLDEIELKAELEEQSNQVIKEWNTLLYTHPGLGNKMQTSNRSSRSRVSSISSVNLLHDSPKIHSSISSPLKTTRMETSSPIGDDISDDSGIRVDRGTYQHMFQDVKNIKGMLLRLQKVLQDSETISPFENCHKNSLLYGSTEAGEDIPQQLADLRRQVVLMEHQIEEKERIIFQLKDELMRKNDTKRIVSKGTTTTKANAATQTVRVRPVSTGPLILEGLSDENRKSFVSTMNKGHKFGAFDHQHNNNYLTNEAA